MTETKANVKTLLKSGFWYTMSSFLSRTISFFTIPIFTRLLSNDEYASFAVYTSWQVVLLTICSLEAHTTLNRARFDFVGEKEYNEYISSSLVLGGCFTGFFLLIYILFPQVLERWLLIERKNIYVMFLYIFAYPAFLMFQTKQRIEYKYRFSATLAMLLMFFSTGLSLLLVTHTETDRLFARITGQYVLYILSGFVLYLYFIFVGKKVRLKCWKYLIRMGMPLVFSYLAGQILLSSDVIIIKHMFSGEEASYLSLVHSISHIVIVLIQTLNTAWAPWFYDMLKSNKIRKIEKAYSVYIWAVIGCTFCWLLLGPEIIRVLGGEKYADSLNSLPPYILCGIFTVFTSQFASLEVYHKKPEYSAALTAIAAVLNVILDIIAVKTWGYLAVCYVTAFCQILLIGMHYKVAQKMQVQDMLPKRKLLLTLCVSIALVPASFLLYMNNAVRYSFVAAAAATVLCLGFLKRKQIKELVSRL